MSDTRIDLQTNIEIFHGEMNPSSAFLYARLSLIENSSGNYRLTGSVRGPTCRLAKTLSSTFSLVDAGAGPSVLAKAQIADPCSWSEGLPAIYHVSLELTRDGEAVASGSVATGLRALGAVGGSFSLDGKRWVMRGARQSADAVQHSSSWSDEDWRENQLVQFVDEAPDSLCQHASERGVRLAVRFRKSQPIDNIVALSRWPAVTAVILPPKSISRLRRERYPNLLFGVEMEECFAESDIPESADFVFCNEDLGAQLHSVIERPIVVYRLVTMTSLTGNYRSSCERLQADLTPLSLAGYVAIG